MARALAHEHEHVDARANGRVAWQWVSVRQAAGVALTLETLEMSMRSPTSSRSWPGMRVCWAGNNLQRNEYRMLRSDSDKVWRAYE